MGVSLSELWIPILVAAVLVFVVSSVIHMVLKWHNSDFKVVKGEADMLAAMRAAGLAPGEYMFPGCTDMKEMATPEMQEKYKAGPVGWMTVLPNGVPNIGKSLWQWFLFSVLIGAMAGYVGTFSLSVGAGYADVFRVTGTVAILGYSITNIPDSIWKGHSWRVTAKYIADGVAYGLVTAGAFAWLWPDAADLL